MYNRLELLTHTPMKNMPSAKLQSLGSVTFAFTLIVFPHFQSYSHQYLFPTILSEFISCFYNTVKTLLSQSAFLAGIPQPPKLLFFFTFHTLSYIFYEFWQMLSVLWPLYSFLHNGFANS